MSRAAEILVIAGGDWSWWWSLGLAAGAMATMTTTLRCAGQNRWTRSRTPGIKDDGELSEQEEQQLFEHYGVPYATQGSTMAKGSPPETGRQFAGNTDIDRSTVGHDTSGPNTDDADDGGRRRSCASERASARPAGRGCASTSSLRTLPTVPVSHEEVRIEREPITHADRDQATSGRTSRSRSMRSSLHQDKVVVDKDTEAKERVRMGPRP